MLAYPQVSGEQAVKTNRSNKCVCVCYTTQLSLSKDKAPHKDSLEELQSKSMRFHKAKVTFRGRRGLRARFVIPD